MQYAVDGLVIRVSESGENDKRLVLLTPDRGRVSVLAKGARSLRSKYMHATPLFTYGNYEISDRGGAAWLLGASVIEPFRGLQEDIERLALASYLVDVAHELSGQDEPAEELLRLCLNLLFALANDQKPKALIKAVFEFRAMSEAGYLPDLSGCRVCGKQRAAYMYLDVMGGRLTCAECLHSLEARATPAEDEARIETILSPLGSAALAVARYVVEVPCEKLLSFSLEDTAIHELGRMSETYLLNHLERSFPSLEFYKNVTKLL